MSDTSTILRPTTSALETNGSRAVPMTSIQGPPLGDFVLPNIASMLERNVRRLPLGGTFNQFDLRRSDRSPFLTDRTPARVHQVSQGPNWLNFVESICMIVRGLREYGLNPGESVAIVSQNRIEMLELELAVMASGGVAIPIFPFYPPAMLDHLLEFCGARFVAVAGAAQLQRLSPVPLIERLFVFDDVSDERFPDLIPFSVLTEGIVRTMDDALLDPFDLSVLDFDADPDTICLRQYTSGTTAKRKLVELSHRNILSQQAALDQVWYLGEHDRFLSYLPWHHSFGGIFELFTALYRCVPMWLEPSSEVPR